MKSKTKKILSLILVLVLICTAVTYAGLHAFAATSGVITDSNDEVILRWNLHDDGLFTVSGNGYGPDYNSSLATPWYRIKSDIKEVIVEEGVQAIGNYWFSGCSNLTKVTLPDSMYKMGARVFQSCSKLENITMPAGCTEYYNYNFSGCTALK